MECPICYEIIKNIHILSCQGKHKICKNCYQLLIDNNNDKCPMCRGHLKEIITKSKNSLWQDLSEGIELLLNNMEEIGEIIIAHHLF